MQQLGSPMTDEGVCDPCAPGDCEGDARGADEMSPRPALGARPDRRPDVLERVGRRPCAQVKQVIDELDLDKNGQVEWKEFACLMAERWLRQEGETDMQLALGLMISEEDDDAEIQLSSSARPASIRTAARRFDMVDASTHPLTPRRASCVQCASCSVSTARRR